MSSGPDDIEYKKYTKSCVLFLHLFQNVTTPIHQYKFFNRISKSIDGKKIPDNFFKSQISNMQSFNNSYNGVQQQGPKTGNVTYNNSGNFVQQGNGNKMTITTGGKTSDVLSTNMGITTR